MGSANGFHGEPNQVNEIAEVEQLIKTLYQPSSPQVVLSTEKYLQSLQRSPEGWQIADALLQSQDVHVRFFGALTFTIKVNQDWVSLTETDAVALLHRLVAWLIHLVRAGESSLVLRKMCSALVAYYLRPSGTLPTCVRHLIFSFQEGHSVEIDSPNNEHSRSLPVASALSAMQLRVVMWFAEGLVEEVSKVNGASIQTYKYFERISSNIGDVVNVLSNAIGPSFTQDAGVAQIGLKCFQSWVMYANRGWVDKGAEVQALRRLTPLALEALQRKEIHDAVTELFTDILNHSPAFLTNGDFRTLSLFLSTSDASTTIARMRGGDIDEEALAFAKLLLAFGDATVQDLAQKPDDSQLSQILYQLIELLNCDGYGGVEDEICSMTLDFFQTYTEYVVDSLFDYQEDKPSWMDVARQRLEAVIEACWIKIRMPPQEIADTWDTDARTSFKSFRKDVHDLLQSSYRLLGVDIFRKLARLALQSLNNRAWLPLEATLFCLNALADLVENDGSVDGMLSQIFSDSYLFVIMTSVAESIPAKTRQTAVNMINSYTAFFKRHTEFLPAMLNFLFESLKSSVLANVAARAILAACSSCRKNLTTELNPFLQQYEEILGYGSVETSTKEKLLGAISAIIEALSTEEEKLAPLTRLIQTIERDVEKCIAATKQSNTEEAQESGISALKCLVGIGKALQASDEVVIDLDAEASGSTFWTEGRGAHLQDQIIGILETVMSLTRDNSEAVEAGCHVLRVGYKERTPGLFVFPLKVTMDFVVTSKLTTPRLDYVLYTAGICLTSRGANKERTMPGFASTLLNHLLGLVSSMDYSPVVDPEASANAIELMEKMIPRHLTSMMITQDIQVLFDFALTGLTVADIMPKRSAAHFWARFMLRHDVSEDINAFLRAAMNRYGPLLTEILVYKFAGEANRSELDELAEPLKRMIFCQPAARTWLSVALNQDTFPSHKIGPPEKRLWLQRIMSLRGAKGTNQAIRDFWIQCRGPDFSYTG